MHYLTDLANKLAATYDPAKAPSEDEPSVERRQKLVAALKRALELEVTPENIKEQSSNPFTEYNAINALWQLRGVPKD